ncbi:MAG: stage II sporulation protein R [Clostridia bacterium]|nr:stage II sporulation protein R [Clostridia bacterium]MDD4686124.1 stage II sporulation protein R [Clostridia bacterium]
MKYLAIILSVFVMGGILVFSSPQELINNDYLRIHIRANSNSDLDQNVKYQVKDAIVDTLIPLLSNCDSSGKSYNILEQNLYKLEGVANTVLMKNNLLYSCKAKLNNENFPTRNYGSLTLESGFYNALILELGQATGDNWWCVVYPPLCFVNGSTSVNVYKSRILEIINSFFN